MITRRRSRKRRWQYFRLSWAVHALLSKSHGTHHSFHRDLCADLRGLWRVKIVTLVQPLLTSFSPPKKKGKRPKSLLSSLKKLKEATKNKSTLFENFSKCRIWSFEFWHFPQIFVLSGNTVWPQALGFQKLVKMDHFWHFWWTFVHSKCKRSSLRSQCWMRLFLWFSNTLCNCLI